jgi:hypothetical protein
MSESIEIVDDTDKHYSNTKKSDFVVLTGNVVNSINFKMAIFLFFIGMLIFSDVFIDSILNQFDGAVHGECATTKGTMIQLIAFILCYIILDLLIQGEWI